MRIKNKKILYSVGTFLLAVIFVCCSLEGMNILLDIQENKRLSDKGMVEVDPPVRTWNEVIEEKEMSDGQIYREAGIDEDIQTEDDLSVMNGLLSLDDVEQVLDAFYNNDIAVSHSPVEGQITASDAEMVCRAWLQRMDINRIYSEDDNEKIAKTLYTRVSSDYYNKQNNYYDKMEPYYSFWEVEFYTERSNIIMDVNAMTGAVWKANIVLYDVENVDTESEIGKLGEFVKASKVLYDTELGNITTEINLDDGYGYASTVLGNSNVYAYVEVYGINDYYNTELQEAQEAYSDTTYDSNIVITSEESENIVLTFGLQF